MSHQPRTRSATREGGGRPGSRRRALRYLLAWLVAAGLAVTVGLVAVTSVGASVRGRGQLGSENLRGIEFAEGQAKPDPDDVPVRDTFEGEFGAFVVECRGPFALGIEARAAREWRTVSFEEGPDDDVDAVFSSGDRSVELEVFCNQGRPTISEREQNTLPSPSPSATP